MEKSITKSKSYVLAITGLMAALTFIGTYIIKIPTPGTGGYIHPGDAFVILSGIILGPYYGALAAGIGSTLSDLIGGYGLYIVPTFVIKALAALAVAFVYHYLVTKIRYSQVKCAISAIFSTIIVALGYFIFEYFVYGEGAIASIPGNIIQGISGLIISTILITAFKSFILYSKDVKTNNQ